MAYTPNPTWVDGAAGGTPITAATLQHIEDGIAAAAAAADAASDGLDGKQALGVPITVAMAAAGSILFQSANGDGSFPARVTSRTDVRVWWFGNASTTSAHAAATRPPLRYPSSYRRVSGVWRPA